MANIKKTFNFRNGVQVDDDNLIVNATGLVGIGTTIPTEALDVRGTAKVVGLVTSQEGFVGVFTAHTSSLGTVALSTSIIGAGVSIKSGIITSNAASGLVTYYGDARFLQGMPTSQWDDIDVGLGYTSIFNTGGNVGVSTGDPRNSFQVGGNVRTGQIGVGINSDGHIKASGIITATGLDINGDIDIDGQTNLDNVSVAGVSTFTGTIDANGNVDVAGTLDVDGHAEFDNVNIAGVSTVATLNATNVNIAGLSTHRVAFTNASDNLTDSDDLTFNDTTNTLNVVGTTDTDQLNVSGLSTFAAAVSFTSTINANDDITIADAKQINVGNGSDLQISHENDVSLIRDTRAGVGATLAIGADKLILRNKDGNEPYLEANDNGSVKIYYDFFPKLETSGVGVTVYNQLDTTNIVASGVITATTELNSPLVGVGTDDPATDIQVRKAGAAQIRVTSDTDAAIVSIGRVAGASNGANAAFRHGNNNAGFPYSKSNSLDLINYDTGSVNFYLNGANQNAGIGSFHWHKGTSTPLMTLNAAGNLGIGITQPEYKLHVSGVSTFVGDVTCGNNLVIGGNLTLSAGSFTGNVTGNLTGNVDGLLNGTPVGMNTISLLEADDGIGIGVTSGGKRFRINNNNATQFYVSNSGQVGVCTNWTFTDVKFAVPDSVSIFSVIGVGTISPRCAADFEFAGGRSNESNANITKRFMIPPKLDNAGRGNLTGLVAGAMIFNVSTNKLNVYNGTAWREVTDGAV